MKESQAEAVVLVTRDQLPMHCPPPDSSLWDGHPRVFIPLEDGGEASCSYCGTKFRLVEDNASSGKSNDGSNT